MKYHMIKHTGLRALLSVSALCVVMGCADDSQEADVVELPDQAQDVRRVVFDKEGVVEIREGRKLVFEREPQGRLPSGPMPDDAQLAVATASNESGESNSNHEPAANTRAELLQSSHVPAKLTPAAVAKEPLSRETSATLEPLPPKVAPPVPITTYGIQVGFFGQRSNAENLRDVLANNDWPVKLVTIDKNNGKTFYLVVVPVRGSKDRASSTKAKIQKQHRLDGIVIRMDSLPS
jgi:cell division protein FtsN